VADTERYQQLDHTITDVILISEKTDGRLYSTRFQWSPTLKWAVQQYRFWRLKLKYVQKGAISQSLLEQYHREAFSLPEAMEKKDISHIIAKWKTSRQTMTAY
jgi:hypothetical protein